MRAYAIGDIHGHLDKLQAAHTLIAADRVRVDDDAAPVVHIGDLVDRGPDSRGVIDFLIEGRARGQNWVVLKGNHDRMLSWYLEEPARRDHCLRAERFYLHEAIGGLETLASYGVDISDPTHEAAIHAAARTAIPATHQAFLSALPTSCAMDGLFFAHAGIRPGVTLGAQTEDDLIWIRQDFYASTADHGALVIHGHTPVDKVTHYANRVNIDTGAGMGHALSAVVIEGREVWLLTEDGRVPVARHPA